MYFARHMQVLLSAPYVSHSQVLLKHMYTMPAPTVRINKPLRNKQQRADTDYKHIHQIKTTYVRSALATTNTYPYYINRTLRHTKQRYKRE